MDQQAIKKTLASFDEKIGRNLKNIRRSRKISQRELAGILGVTFQQMQKYEQGQNRLSAGKLCRLKSYLNVPYEAFFAGVDGCEEEQATVQEGTFLKILQKAASHPDPSLRDKIARILNVLMS